MNVLAEFIKHVIREKKQEIDLTPADGHDVVDDDLTPGYDDEDGQFDEEAPEPDEDELMQKHRKVLKALNVELIPSGRSSEGFIGKGQFNYAYEGLYQGKHCVVKLSTTKKEADSSRKMKVVKNAVPEEIGKHLPLIYLVKTVRLENTVFYVTVVEYLKEMDTSLKAVVFAGDYEPHFKNAALMTMRHFIKDSDEIHEIVSDQLDKKFGRDDKFKVIRQKLINMITNKLRSFLKMVVANVESGNTVISIDNVRRTSRMVDAIVDVLQQTDLEWEYKDAVGIDKLIKQQILKTDNHFPKHFDTTAKPEFKDSRVKELYDALVYLDKKNITAWSDLHRYNVMMRDGKTLVVSDFGLFRWPKQYSRK